jgi:hypothetical protein
MRLRSSSLGYSALIATVLSSIASHAAVTIEFLSPSAHWSTSEKDAVFYLKANGGGDFWRSLLN